MKFTLALLSASIASAATLVEVLTAENETTLLSLVASSPDVTAVVNAFSGTFFAPTDAALLATVDAGFNVSDIAALDTVLPYHAVAGQKISGVNLTGTYFLPTLEGNEVKVVGSSSGVTVGSAFGVPAANVVKSVAFDNGFVHIIDETLLPPAGIADVATAANLTSLLSALTTAELTSTVVGLKNATILAPTNEAFAAIASVIPTLTAAQLKQVLLLHVIPNGLVHSTDIIAAKSLSNVATASDYKLSITVDGGKVKISGTGNKTPATVTVADVFADGVIVHVIDTVLLPDLSTAPKTINTSGAKSVLASAFAAAAGVFIAM